MLVCMILAAQATLQHLKESENFTQSLISWPNTWVNSRFEPDSNYIESCTKFHFYFRIEDKEFDLRDYRASVEFKQVSDIVSCFLSSISESEPDWKATCDYSFRLPNLIYGPFDIKIFHIGSKNIIARDSAAGFLAFKNGSEPIGGNLLVSYQDPSSSRVVESTTSLLFEVTLPLKESLYPGDYFEIVPDKDFLITSLELLWVDMLSSSILFKNTEVSVIVDKTSSTTSVIVYGLENEVLRGSNISFVLSGWSNPSTVRKGENYSWTLKIWRYGVKTLIKSYTGQGPNLSTLSGQVFIKEFKPTVSSAFIPENIIHGLNVYWTLIFSCEHFIPFGGKFLIEFQGVRLTDYSIKTSSFQTRSTASGPNALFAYNNSNFSLKSSFEASNQVSIELPSEQALLIRHTIKLITYVKILDEKEIGISRIVAKNFDGAVIDELQSPKKVKVLKDNTFFDKDAGVYLMRAVDAINEVTEFNRVGEFGIVAWINPEFELIPGTSILIYMPVSTGIAAKADDLVFNENYYALATSDENYLGLSSSMFSSSFEESVNITEGLINVTLNNTYPASRLFIFIGSGTALQPNLTYTQLIPTKYPSETILKYSNVTNTFIYTSLFYISSSSLELTFIMLCSNVYKPGSPGKVTFSTVSWPVPGNYTFQVFFRFIEKQGSNVSTFDLFSPSKLNDGDPYPSSDSSRSLRVSSTKEIYYSQSSDLENSTKIIVVPLPLTTSGNQYAVEVRVLAVSTLFKDKFLLYSGISEFFQTTEEDVTSGKPTSHEQLIKKILTPVTVLLALRNEPADSDRNGKIEFEPSWYSFMLITPSGWRSTDSILTSGTSLISDNYLFPYSVYFKNSVNIVYETVPYVTHYLRFTTGWMTNYALDYTFVIGYTISKLEFSGMKCVSIKGSVNVKPEKLLVYNYGPNIISSYTYNARTASTSVSFMSTTSRIHKGSVIRVIINQWKPSRNITWTVLNGTKEIHGTFSELVWVSQEIQDEIKPNVEITIQVDNVFLPKLHEKSILGFSSIQVLYQGAIYMYWDEEGSTTITDIIEFISPIQGTSRADVWVYPDVKGSKDVTFGLSFNSEYKIPSGSTISIKANFKNHFNVEQDLSASHFFSSARVKAGFLYIVTNQDILKTEKFSLTLDKAFDISDNSNSTSDLVLLNVTCDDLDNTVAISDVSQKSSSQFYRVKDNPSGSVIMFSYSSSSLTPGENNWYSFQLKLDCNITDVFYIQVHAIGDFDVVPGPFFEQSEFEGLKLIRGRKSRGSSLICFSHQWRISCLFEESHSVNQTIKFELYLKNGLSSGKFNLYILNTKQELIVQPFYGKQELIFNHNVANSIDLYFARAYYSVDPSKAYHDLKLYAKVNMTVYEREQIIVTVPRPYDLSYSNPGSVLCSLIYYNNQDKTVDQVFTRDRCMVTQNSVIFIFSEMKKFHSTNWTIFTLHGLESPEVGYERNRWPFERSQNYKIFTRQFEISHFRYDENLTDFVFSNLNSAFLGFSPNKNFVRLQVNGGKSIDLTPGVYSGPYLIASKDGDIKSKNIQIVGFEVKQNDNTQRLELYNQGYYKLDYLNTKTTFFIGTNVSTPQGFYLIDWKINETTFPGVETKYIRPRPTLVQVSDKKRHEIIINPDKIFVPVRKTSFPLSISTKPEKKSVFPFSEVSLNLSSSDASMKLSIFPNPVPLKRNLQSNHFVLSCTNCEAYSEYNISVQVIGNDSEAYFSKDFFTFSYEFEYEVAANASIVIENVSSTGFNFSIQSDSRSVVTWCLISNQLFDSDTVQYENLLTRVNILGSGIHQHPTIDDQLKSIQEKYEKVYSELTEVSEIAREIQKIGSQVFITGQSVINEGKTKICSFSVLFPGNIYRIHAYIDNYSPENPVVAYVTQRTADLSNHIYISLDSEAADVENFKNQIVSLMKWRPQLINVVTNDFRSLSGWFIVILADPLNSFSPASVLKNNQKSISAVIGGKVNYTEILPEDYEHEIEFKIQLMITKRYLELNYLANVDGELICTIQNGSISVSSTESVYLGINSNGEPVEQRRQKTHAMINGSWNSTIFNSGRLFIDCIVCNEYPITPNCSEVQSQSYDYSSLSAQQLLSLVFWIFLPFV